MSCSWIYFSNLHWKISKEDLENQLVTTFPDEFGEPFRQKTLNVEVFLPLENQRGQQRKGARASGFTIDFDAFKLKSACHKLWGRNWVVHKDRGDDRNEYGEFKVKLNPKLRRAMLNLSGTVIKKPVFLLRDELVSQLNSSVFTRTAVVYAKGHVTKNLMSEPGYLLSYLPIEKTNITKVVYATVLEAMQAIMLLNGRDNTWFCDETGSVLCTYTKQQGLGNNGEKVLINFKCNDTNKQTYIKLDDMTQVIDVDRINSMNTYCWKCKQKYKPVGVDPHLDFIAAKCMCQYDSLLDIGDRERAYFRHGENFTRLMLGFNNKQTELGYDWAIWHESMKDKYDSPKEFRNIVAPIMQDEWKFTSRDFKAKNSTSGVLFCAKIVDKKDKNELYSILINVDKTFFWNTEAIYKIGRLTLEFKVREKKNKEHVSAEKRKAALCWISEKDNQLTLYTRMYLCSKLEPLPQSVISVTPKPIKTQYSNSRRILKLFAEKNRGTYAALEQICLKESTLTFNENHAQYNREHNMLRSRFYRLKSATNTGQKTAFEKAIISPLSVIQGPPGTGKTFLGSTIAVALRITEVGHVIYTAPSHYAVDGAVQKLLQVSRTNVIPVRVLRIYPKNREHATFSAVENEGHNSNFGNLHELVLSSERWLSGEKFDGIRTNVNENRRDLLTIAEKKLLDEHETSIEKEIMEQFNVFALTVGCLDDKRVLFYGKPDKIGTIIVDEAGQLTETSSLQIFTYNQRRTIIIGDNKQLRAQLASYGSQFAGLGYSVMDWLEKSKSVPWTMLTEQHRMNPANREIVSSLTYEGQLTDAPAAKQQPNWVSAIQTTFSPCLKSQVVVLNHKYLDKQVGTSYVNVDEVNITAALCTHMLQNRITSSQITVLTLYEAQRSLLASKLDEFNINVQNVDAFQGRENDVIILNLVRGGHGEIGFGANQNRLNVALSRSKKFLFILCNVETFQKHPSQIVTKFLRLLNIHADVRESKKEDNAFIF